MDLNRTFDRALAAQRDVSETFFGDFGFSEERARTLNEFEANLIRLVRERMTSGTGKDRRLFVISDEIAPYFAEARGQLDGGEVAAVDGTDASAKLDFNVTTQYACAVGWITSLERGAPHITITETDSEYIDPVNLNQQPIDVSEKIYAALMEARVQQSWPTTFREYRERYIAMTEAPARFVLLDGPIFTQNLMTQVEGRKLYDKMLRTSKSYIGVIKDLRGSDPAYKWYAGALNSGEGYIAGDVGTPILRTHDNATLSSWIDNGGVNDFVRVVYRPAEKAFAFECRRDQVGLACAILMQDASPTINHELPLLMEVIDSQLRSGFNASATRDLILQRRMTLPGGYQAAIDATNERDYR